VAWSRQHQLDYYLVRLAESVGDDVVGGTQRGWFALSPDRFPGTGRLPDPYDKLIQLHYPEGGPMSASFVSIAETEKQSRLAYEHATAAGSSGAPCIRTSDFTVVGMHEGKSLGVDRGEAVYSADILKDLEKQSIRLPQLA
jgi:hypothetical protein